MKEKITNKNFYNETSEFKDEKILLGLAKNMAWESYWMLYGKQNLNDIVKLFKLHFKHSHIFKLKSIKLKSNGDCTLCVHFIIDHCEGEKNDFNYEFNIFDYPRNSIIDGEDLVHFVTAPIKEQYYEQCIKNIKEENDKIFIDINCLRNTYYPMIHYATLRDKIKKI